MVGIIGSTVFGVWVEKIQKVKNQIQTNSLRTTRFLSFLFVYFHAYLDGVA